jgi:hypothetical protein
MRKGNEGFLISEMAKRIQQASNKTRTKNQLMLRRSILSNFFASFAIKKNLRF